MKSLLLIPFLFMFSMVIGQTVESHLKDVKKVIGTPFKLGYLEVAQNDFNANLNWNNAEAACEALGGDWRLPTKDELNLLYINKDKIGGFEDDMYWSGTSYKINSNISSNIKPTKWVQYFNIGEQSSGRPMTAPGRVRAVRWNPSGKP